MLSMRKAKQIALGLLASSALSVTPVFGEPAVAPQPGVSRTAALLQLMRQRSKFSPQELYNQIHAVRAGYQQTSAATPSYQSTEAPVELPAVPQPSNPDLESRVSTTREQSAPRGQGTLLPDEIGPFVKPSYETKRGRWDEKDLQNPLKNYFGWVKKINSPARLARFLDEHIQEGSKPRVFTDHYGKRREMELGVEDGPDYMKDPVQTYLSGGNCLDQSGFGDYCLSFNGNETKIIAIRPKHGKHHVILASRNPDESTWTWTDKLKGHQGGYNDLTALVNGYVNDFTLDGFWSGDPLTHLEGWTHYEILERDFDPESTKNYKVVQIVHREDAGKVAATPIKTVSPPPIPRIVEQPTPKPIPPSAPKQVYVATSTPVEIPRPLAPPLIPTVAPVKVPTSKPVEPTPRLLKATKAEETRHEQPVSLDFLLYQYPPVAVSSVGSQEQTAYAPSPPQKVSKPTRAPLPRPANLPTRAPAPSPRTPIRVPVASPKSVSTPAPYTPAKKQVRQAPSKAPRTMAHPPVPAPAIPRPAAQHPTPVLAVPSHSPIDWQHLDRVLATKEYSGSIQDLFEYGFHRSKAERFSLIRKNVDSNYAGRADQNTKYNRDFRKAVRERNEKVVSLFFYKVESPKAAGKKPPQKQGSSKQDNPSQETRTSLDIRLYQYSPKESRSASEQQNVVSPVRHGRNLDLQALKQSLETLSRAPKHQASPGYSRDATQKRYAPSRSSKGALDVEGLRSYLRSSRNASSETTSRGQLDLASLHSDLKRERAQPFDGRPEAAMAYKQRTDELIMSPPAFEQGIRAVERSLSRVYSHHLRGISRDIVDPMMAALLECNPYKILSDGRPDYTSSQLAERVKDMALNAVTKGQGGLTKTDLEVYEIMRTVINQSYQTSDRLRASYETRFNTPWSPIQQASMTEVGRLIGAACVNIQEETHQDHQHNRNGQVVKMFLPLLLF